MGQELDAVAHHLRVDAAMHNSLADVGAADSASPLRDAYVRAALRRCASLVGSCAQLAPGANGLGLEALFRVLTEEFIRLHWVTLSEENAQYVVHAERDSFAAFVQVNIENGPLRMRNVETGADATKEVLNSGALKKKNQTKESVESMARSAGIADLYNVVYRHNSQATHGRDSDVTRWSDAGTILGTLEAIACFSGMVGRESHLWLMCRTRMDTAAVRESIGASDPRDTFGSR